MHFIQNKNIIVENLFGNIDMNEINLNEQTKTIRDYKFVLDYSNPIMKIFFYISLTAVPMFVFLILKIFGFLENGNNALTGLYNTCLVIVLAGAIGWLFQLGFSEKSMKFINRKIYKIDNKYAEFIFFATDFYDRNNELYQSKVYKLENHISSPYFNQEMLDDIIKLDKYTMLLIDIDTRGNKQHLSQACFEIICSELAELVGKFEKIESQYKQKKNEEKQEQKEKLLESLKNHESNENEPQYEP